VEQSSTLYIEDEGPKNASGNVNDSLMSKNVNLNCS